MADYVEVKTSTLGQDTEELESTLALVRKAMKDMFNAVTELDGMWDGPANKAFNQQFAKDHQVFEEVAEAVNGIIDSMKNAKTLYEKCEATVSNEIDRIRI